MKRLLTLTALLAVFGLGSSAVSNAAEPRELTVFAAASLTETLEKIAALYKTKAPDITLTFNFDSSGTLLTQIKEGAVCDVFISAGQKQMDELEKSGRPSLLAGTRFDILENRLVLAVPSGNPGGIHSFQEAGRAKSIALGNPDVPVGQYAEEIFRNLGLWTDDFKGRATLGGNVKEVTAWVKEGAADCGVVYATDAQAAGLEVAASAPEGALKTRALYPAAALAAAPAPAEAKAFLDYLRSAEATAIFVNAGFSIPE